MTQPDVFLVKAVSEIAQLLHRRSKGRLAELAATFGALQRSKTLSADFAAHKPECVVPVVELAQEAYAAKQYVVCNKALDLLEKLILHGHVVAMPVVYNYTTTDCIVLVVNVATQMFRYTNAATNLFVAKLLTTIAGRYVGTLDTAYVTAIFETVFDMQVIASPSDPNAGAFQMCVLQLVDLVLSAMDGPAPAGPRGGSSAAPSDAPSVDAPDAPSAGAPHADAPPAAPPTDAPGDAPPDGDSGSDDAARAANARRHGVALLRVLASRATEAWTARPLKVAEYAFFVSTATPELRRSLDHRAKLLALTLVETWLTKLPPVLRTGAFLTAEVGGLVGGCVLSNGVGVGPKVFRAVLRVVRALVGYRSVLKGAVGAVLSEYVCGQLRGSGDGAAAVLGLLHEVLRDGALIVELFYNYDCDVGEPDVAELLVGGVLGHVGGGATGAALEVVGDVVGAMERSASAWEGTLRAALGDEGAGLPASTEDVSALKERKRVYGRGCALFNESPKKGLAYFEGAGLCEHTPASVVGLLRRVRVDRGRLGDFLGGADEFSVGCLGAYVGSLDFGGLEVDEALRVLFGSFAMGGEGQVVTRVMTAFAAHYVSFGDAVNRALDEQQTFQLVMSVIFLATESHNPNVKNRFLSSFDAFRGVVKSESDFNIAISDERLRGIYERVVAAPFEAGPGACGAAASRPYDGRVSADAVRELHETTADGICRAAARAAASAIAGASSGDAGAASVLGRAVGVLRGELHLSAVFLLEGTVDTILGALVGLSGVERPEAIGAGELAVIRTLLGVPRADGEFLLVGWRPVLRLVLRIERLRQCAGGWRDGAAEAAAMPAATTFPVLRRFVLRRAAAVRPSAAVSEISAGEVNDVFTESGALGHRAVKAFFRAACEAVVDELDDGSPGVFDFQYVVVAASANAGRGAEAWASLWDSLGDLFHKAAMHPVASVAVGALDTLRQVVAMQGDEAGTDNMRRALQPYVRAVADHPSEAVKRYALTCVKQLVTSGGTAGRLGTGWVSVLEFLRFAADVAAGGEAPSVAEDGFAVLSYAYAEHREAVLGNFDLFVRALLAFQRTAGAEHVLFRVVEIDLSVLRTVSLPVAGDATPMAVAAPALRDGPRRVERFVGTLSAGAHRYLLRYLPLFTSLASAVSGDFQAIAVDALDQLTGFLLPLPDDLRHSLFLHSVLRCFSPDLPSATFTVLPLLFKATLRFPIGYAEPVIAFAFSVLLNTEKFHEHAAVFLASVAGRDDFAGVRDAFMRGQRAFFAGAVDAVRGVSAERPVDGRAVRGVSATCGKCGKAGVAALMARCPGCLREHFCAECAANEHCDACVRTWWEWRIAPAGHAGVAVKGLGLYLQALRGKRSELESVLMVRELRAGLVGAVRELGVGRLGDGYEAVMRASLEWAVGAVEDAEVRGYVCDEVRRLAGEYAEHGATAATSAGQVGHAVDAVLGLGDEAFGAVFGAVGKDIVELVESDDGALRGKVKRVVLRAISRDCIH